MKLIPQDNPEAGRVWLVNGGGGRVAELDLTTLSVPEALTLANRLAAADDLLAACEQAHSATHDHWDETGGKMCCECIQANEMLTAAIAKAKS